MKNSTILSICLIAMVSIIGLSCEKNSEEVKFMEVEYGILPLDEHISSITYIDASGKPVVTDDRAEFVNGSKKLSVSAKSFTATMEVLINNTTQDEKRYIIGILVDGDVRAFENVTCPPNAMALGKVEYKIQ